MFDWFLLLNMSIVDAKPKNYQKKAQHTPTPPKLVSSMTSKVPYKGKNQKERLLNH